MFDKLMKILKIKFASSLLLKDGTQLELNGDFDTGVQVSVITSDGPVTLPDGEYQLEDMTIIMVKDGLVTDIIKPGEVEKETEGLDPMGNDTNVDELSEEKPTEELAAQSGNPDVSGTEPVKEDEMPTSTGTTEKTEEPIEAAELPIEEPEVEPEDKKIAELEVKIASLEQALTDIMAKLNMISEKFTIAQPIVKKKEDNSIAINPKLQNKVDLIKSLRKS